MEDLQKIWSKIILKAYHKEAILGSIQLFNSGDSAAPRGILLYGPPGTGKTELVRGIAASTKSSFLPVGLKDLKATYIGQTSQRVKEVWDKVRAHERCVMFIDDCELVFPRVGERYRNSFTDEVIQEFLVQWEAFGPAGKVLILGETTRRDGIDEAILSRFDAQVELSLPDASDRYQLLRLEAQKLSVEGKIPELASSLTAGFSGRDLANLARDVYAAAVERKSEVTPEMWKQAILERARPNPPDPEARWDSLILNEGVLAKLKSLCESLRLANVSPKPGFRPAGGAILYGPPGTGKTHLARVIAAESSRSLICTSPMDLKGGYIGQTGHNVRELFARARKHSPCILFFDEIDVIAPARGSAYADHSTDEILVELLIQIDGVKAEGDVFLLGATLYPERIDLALMSRMTYKIEIPNLDVKESQRLFKMLLRKMHANFDFDVDAMAAELAVKSAKTNGRGIRNLVNHAAEVAVTRALNEGRLNRIELTRQDLLSEIDRTR